MNPALQSSVTSDDIEAIFTEVKHHESLGLLNPTELRLFHLNTSGNRFIYASLDDFLVNIVSQYVFSRVQVDALNKQNPNAVGIRALRVMKKNGAADEKGTGNELGEILLYAFLEGELHAPKLFSKVELKGAASSISKESDSIHLLSLPDIGDVPCYQTVFGTSDIKGDVRDAIDKAFDAIQRIDAETGQGLSVVDAHVLNESFDESMLDEIKSILIPDGKQKVVNEHAYGIFLGYTLGLDPSTRSVSEFLKALDQKMEMDIQNHAGYISKKIHELGLESHSFYVYLVPFNSAETDKKEIMENLFA